MLFLSSPTVPTTNCTDVVSSPDSHDTLHSAYAHIVDYINGTRTNITVIERNGIKITIPPSGLRDVRGFIVKSTFKFNDTVNFDADTILNDVTENSSVELRQLKDAMIHGLKQKVYGYTVISIEYNIDVNELLESGGVMYYSNLDLIISARDPIHTPPHPFSTEGRKLQLLTEDEDVNTVETFGYKLKIIDNDDSYGERWINIAGRPFRIPAVHDHALENGVYLICTGNAAGAPPTIERYTYADAETRLHLYKSKDEAIALGDIFAKRETELREQELIFKQIEQDHKLARQKMQQELDEEERAFKLKTLELEKELQRLNQLKDEADHQRKLEEIRRKDYYEDRSYVRKDSSEFLKFAPVVIGGLFALVAALRG